MQQTSLPESFELKLFSHNIVSLQVSSTATLQPPAAARAPEEAPGATEVAGGAASAEAKASAGVKETAVKGREEVTSGGTAAEGKSGKRKAMQVRDPGQRCLTQGVFTVVLQMSIPIQSRQLTLYISANKR